MQPKRPILWLVLFVSLFTVTQYLTGSDHNIAGSFLQALIIGLLTLGILSAGKIAEWFKSDSKGGTQG